MYLASQIIFWVPYIGASLVLVVLLYFFLFRESRYEGFLKWALILAWTFFLISWLGEILVLFLAIKSSSLANELIDGKNSFFAERALNISESFLITLAIALVLYLIGKLIVKYQKKPYFEDFFPMILLVVALSLNFINVIPALILTFFLAIITQLIYLAFRKNQDRLSLVPYLLLASFLVHMMTFFPFYSQLLSKMHLI